MKKKIFLSVVIILTVRMSFFCKNQNHGNENKTETKITKQNNDSISHANGRTLFGMYCITCHTYSTNGPLLGNTKNISLVKFFDYLLKDSINIKQDNKKNNHLKFDMLTKKDISDIKYYLDKG